jgi:hypothetical protein
MQQFAIDMRYIVLLLTSELYFSNHKNEISSKPIVWYYCG